MAHIVEVWYVRHPLHRCSEKTKSEPYKGKIRLSGTDCLYKINDHLWEDSYYPHTTTASASSIMPTPKPAMYARQSLRK